MAKFADVIVDRHHQRVDQIYTYKVPVEQEEQIQPGFLAEVPFGSGGPSVRGYVIRLSDRTDLPEAKLKPLRRLLGKEPVFSSEDLALAEYIRERWSATLSSCLALFVPRDPEALFRTRRRIILQGEGKGRLGPRQKEFLQRLAGAESRSALWEDLSEEGALNRASLQSLEKNGWIRIVDEPEELPPAAFISEKRTQPLILNAEQERARQAVTAAAEQGRHEVFLLHGITGSGKTEVYLQCIESVLKMDRQAILLVPEISLTPQLVRILQGRFGGSVGVLHSRMSDKERSLQWERARKGKLQVMIGPRSALFTPFPRLGLVILDEEHEGSYKSEEMPAYHAREVAGELCRRRSCPLLLGSATPSVESYYRARKGEYTLLELPKRATGAALPQVHTVDMREEAAQGRMGLFCGELIRGMRQRLERGEQTILLLNRKGYATFVNCRSCGFVLRCPRCYLPYTYHRDKDRLICHHCGKTAALPERCPQCGSPHVRQFGVGTQRVEEEVRRLFPAARIRRMDLNTAGSRDAYDSLYESMTAGDTDILIGTQMVAKGFDFPGVTLVGIVAADMMLYSPDYHSTERTFQLLTQASGRAGRGDRPGEVILQTFSPEHYCIQSACRQDYRAFFQQELEARRLMGCPPFMHMLQLLVTNRDEETVRRDVSRLHQILEQYGKGRDFVLLGPSPASLGRINNVFRWKILIKYPQEERLRNYGRYCVEQFLKERPRSVVSSDMDPDAML